MYLIVIAWLYVALMMAVAEATSPVGSVVGAFFTFLLYGVGPVSLVIYLIGTPARRKRIKARESEESAQYAAQQAAQESGQPDGGGEPAADAVPPVRKEP